jgi:hypothetical protein
LQAYNGDSARNRKAIMLRRGLLLAAAAAALAVAAPAAAKLLDVGALDDPAGDGTPDIARIAVGSNATAVTFIVTLANKTALAEGEQVLVLVDSDMNQETGFEGIEFALVLQREGAGLFRWDGTNLVDAQSQSVYGYSYKGFRLAVNRADLGLTTGTLRFVVLTAPLDAGDQAPNDALAEYVLANNPLALQVAKFTAAKAIVAGRKFTTALQVRRNDLNEISSAGEVRCTARYGAKTVKVTPSFPAEAGICSGTAPRAAKGKVLKVTTTFILDGVRVTRTASIRVR